jgi:cysteinyl-tRNA synthetase
MLRIHNSLSGQVEAFVPLVPGQVSLYVCGITVYDYCHIGHLRMMVVFDVVRRYLRHSGYAVTFVRNITDIDDKIIRRAAENGEPMAALTARFITAMDEDSALLGVERPDVEPRATEYVPQIIALIQRLIERGHAYVASSGDVLYAVASFADYGRLSGKRLADLRAGARVDIEESKRDPLDFVLWKRAKPGEPSWASPWGEGRPGWHIECSAMSTALLGSQLDIHGGGADLQFPHHENEIAQSEGAHPGTFVRYWMHNGFVRVDDEKMSKSLGNFFTIREVLKAFDPEVLRLFVLRAHYRSPLNYSDVHLEDARASLMRLYTALSAGVPPAATPDWHHPDCRRFADALNDDFNTPVAMSVLFDLVTELNRNRDPEVERRLRALAGVLGLLGRDREAVVRSGLRGIAISTDGLSDTQIEEQVAQRSAAKKARQFAEADRIRAELLAAGIVLEDSAAGTTWRRA